jgi:phage baseplate assembly protein W
MNGVDDVQGAAFPFQVDPNSGGIAMSSGAAKIAANVRVIIATRIGERPMLRDFGTGVPGLVHDPNDEVLVDIASKQAVAALLRWEPRILVTGTSVEQDPDLGEFQMRIDYTRANEQVAATAVLPLA